MYFLNTNIYALSLCRGSRGPSVGQYTVDLSSFESLAFPELSGKVGQIFLIFCEFKGTLCTGEIISNKLVFFK